METKSKDRIQKELKDLQEELREAREIIEAIRTGQIDALVVNNNNGHALYTLKSADRSYRVFIEKMAEGAVTLNQSGFIVYSNTMFASMVGRPLTKVIGSLFSDFITDECKEIFQQLFERGWREDVKREISLAAIQNVVPVQLSVNALELDAGVSLNLIVTDLTHQKETEKMLKEKNEQMEMLIEALASSNYDLQQFASVASHDLQEPLRKIQVYSRFLKDRNFSGLPDDAKGFVEKIISSSNRMKALIVDILTYSRLSAEDTNFVAVDMCELLNEIIDDFELTIKEKNAVIELGDLPVIEVNRSQIRQLFSNLISNGLKFARPDVPSHIIIRRMPINPKALGLSLTNKENYCMISIKDNGIGFDEKFSSTIFSLFEKLNPKSVFEGSGIGLAIAKKIIDKHNGFIVARSTEGEGSEFNVILPYKRENANAS